jgi:hypothetical protein
MTLNTSEKDIQTVWSSLMLRLCSRHRINVRNGRPTDYRIEDLRTDQFSGGFTNSEYFKRIIEELAKRHTEIQVDGDIVRLTKYGLDNCKKYDPTFQRDF